MTLEINSLTKIFGTAKALDAVTFSVPTGSLVGVIGRSGAGKSTLLRAINRLSDATSGQILFNGADVSAYKAADLLRWRARAAMVFQQFNLAGRLDVMTNVLLGRLSHVSTLRAALNLYSETDRAIATAALDLVDMADYAAQRAESLSGGQQQRVAIARALAQEPELILADEPVASLDPRNTRIVMDTLQRLNREFGITILVNLHSIDLARHYCDRLIGLQGGRMFFDGTAAQLTDGVVRDLYGMESGEAGVENNPLSAVQPVANMEMTK
ncbi:MAG: phosphonate ABC transporter ATP-binding protein [Rhodobacterales bacterium]|nr:phosphonate ABC transporter ATP-binding protein [Rhodobacterales bacterium]